MDLMLLFQSLVVEPLQQCHPVWMILAMGVLPLVGVPVMPLWVAAGISHGPLWGSILSLLALTLNVSLGYALARRWLSGPIRRFLEKRGYPCTLENSREEWLFILLCRIVPGLPLAMQNYVLGCARVRFDRYLIVSIPGQGLYLVGFVLFGNSIKNSSLMQVLGCAALLVAIGLVVGLVRRRYRRQMESIRQQPPPGTPDSKT